jgi:hypothetical protein
MITRKTRSDAAWHSLTPEARDQIESWLFDEHLSYTDAFAKAKTELAFPSSLSSFKRFGFHLAQERVIRQFADSGKQARAIEKAKTSEDQLRNAGMKVMAQTFLHQVVQSPENVRDWGWIAKLLIQNNENQIRERAAVEQQKLRSESLALARQRFEFKAAKAALKLAPMMNEITVEEEARELARIEDIKRRLFGKEIEGIDDFEPTQTPVSPLKFA